MKPIILPFFFLVLTLAAQPNTEVFLFDINTSDSNFKLSNKRNISQNEGYDNQPSFLNNDILFYARTRDEQTDIVSYNMKTNTTNFISDTEGSEYSPLKIPTEEAVSSIRLEKDGTQKLYKYNLEDGKSEPLIDEIIIGYHVWYDNNTLVSSVLEDDGLSLYTSFIKEKKNRKYAANIGRSLHKIPNSDLVSYISKTDAKAWEIRSINPTNGETKGVIETLPETEDMCWLPDGTILMGHKNTLYTFKPGKDVDWKEAASLESDAIIDITRVAISPDGSTLALVGIDANAELEPKLENISWIAGNWKGEALGGQVEEHWSQPSGGSMMASFKLIQNDEVAFYEIEIIRELENTLVLQLKHFNNDLKGWETKDETVDFPLKKITANKVVFEGMTFERINANEMMVSVDVEDNGEVQTLKFNYKK